MLVVRNWSQQTDSWHNSDCYLSLLTKVSTEPRLQRPWNVQLFDSPIFQIAMAMEAACTIVAHTLRQLSTIRKFLKGRLLQMWKILHVQLLAGVVN